MSLIIGNIVALAASIAMAISGILKKKNQILIAQSIQIGLFVISNLVLGGYVGAVVNFINFIRNILCYKDKLGIREMIIITILLIALSIYFNNLGIIGMLPLVGSILYLWFMNIKDVAKFKILIIFITILWLIYDMFIKSYTSSVFDFITIVASIISLYAIQKKLLISNFFS